MFGGVIKSEFLERNRNINRGFRKLEIWKKAVEIYRQVHNVIKKNRDIPFKVKAQIEDSALSISSNIAEGYSRRSIKETLRFYEIVLASSAENYSQLFTLFNAEQILEDDFNDYDAKLYEFENGLVKMNKSLINRMNSVQEWNIDYE
ncbi:MAG: four helix bundle protein [Melioribacteraceae bacterium]